MNGLGVQMLPAENADALPGIYNWGMDVIRTIQSIANPALTALMVFISELGTAKLYLPIILFIFWWIDEKKGLRLGILLILSIWINAFLKAVLSQPRPFHLDRSLGLVYVSGFGIPSGHAQTGLCFWIALAAWLAGLVERAGRKRLVWAGAILFVLLISFSRLYLGVHFPTDIFAGWVIGGIILFVWFVFSPSVIKLFSAATTRIQNICAAIIAIIMNGLPPMDRTTPSLFLGFCTGYVIMKSRFPFSAREEVNGKKPSLTIVTVRCLTGFLGMAIIFIGTGFIFPGEESLFRDFYYWSIGSPFFELGQFVRYGLIGLWASLGAPRVFQIMGLAPNKMEEQSQ